MNDAALWWTTAVFTLTYLGLALGRIPGLRMDRAGIALVGATVMLVAGLLPFDQAVSSSEGPSRGAIDYRTLALLFGMMVVVAFLRLSGFFAHLAHFALRQIKTPLGLLAVTIALSGVLSAFLINDIVCLTMTPLVLHLARRFKFDPVPHLIALATAANIGSAGTITGNPQNIYIGSHSGISYGRFAVRLLPVAALGLVLDFLVVAFVYRRSLLSRSETHLDHARQPEPIDSRAHRWLRWKSGGLTLIAVVLFFTGLPLEMVALGAAAILLLGRVKPQKVYGQIDWSLLVMFAGLFVVIHAFQVHVVAHWHIETWIWLFDRPIDLLSAVSAFLSNIVSNVPAVLLLEPVVQAVPSVDRESAWLALAMSSTLAGNLTVLGSVANLIVVENAGREGVSIGFWEYCKVGIPITLLTLALGIAWLRFVPY